MFQGEEEVIFNTHFRWTTTMPCINWYWFFVTVDLDQVLTGAPLYTTTVRKPLDHLKSVFNYFAMADKFGKLTLHSRFHSSFCYKNTINTHYIISLILVFTAVFHKRASDSLKKTYFTIVSLVNCLKVILNLKDNFDVEWILPNHNVSPYRYTKKLHGSSHRIH